MCIRDRLRSELDLDKAEGHLLSLGPERACDDPDFSVGDVLQHAARVRVVPLPSAVADADDLVAVQDFLGSGGLGDLPVPTSRQSELTDRLPVRSLQEPIQLVNAPATGTHG